MTLKLALFPCNGSRLVFEPLYKLEDNVNKQHHCSTDCSDKQDLLTLDAALETLVEGISPLTKHDSVSLPASANRILAQEITAQVSVPPCDNSAVDGYAINTRHSTVDTWINVSQRIPAGSAPEALTPGTAARIFTGASIPEGANAVLMQEDCETQESAIRFRQVATEGLNIRRQGQDLATGQSILRPGQVMHPHAIGLAASAGIAKVAVHARPVIAIFSTGDELVEPGQSISGGQIFNSNRYLLLALLNNLGCEVLDLGVIADSRPATEQALKQAATHADMIISTGGASVGEEDHVKAAVSALGSLNLWRIALKPGKPFMFGDIDHTPFLGLPGNPGAVLVTFCLLARPAILKRMGCAQILPPSQQRALAFTPGKNGKRREFKRVQCLPDGRLLAHPNQSSGMLSSACWSDGLAVIPEFSELNEGDAVEFYSFDSLMNLPYSGIRS